MTENNVTKGNNAPDSQQNPFNDENAAEKGTSVDEIENAAGDTAAATPDTKWTILKKHLRKYWYWYVIGNIIFLAIFLPLFLIYGVPAIAQDIINAVDLPVNAASLMDPTPDTITFGIDTALNIPIKTPIKTEPFTLGLFNRETKPITPWLHASFPEYTIKGFKEMVQTNKDHDILNEEEIIRTLSNAIHSKKFTLSCKGRIMAHLSALKAHLTLEKDIEMDGFDELRGWSIDSIKLLLPPEEDGTNLRGEVILPNHSVVTIALGNITFHLKSFDLELGHVSIDNTVLRPGDNKYPMYGYLNITEALHNLPELLSSQRKALSDGELEISVSGKTSVYNGQHIHYYEEMLKHTTLSTRLPLSKIVQGTLNGLTQNKTDTVKTFSDYINSTELSTSLKRSGYLDPDL